MSKNKKKRNKKYAGAEATMNKTHITKVVAVKRGPLKQWYADKKMILIPILKVIGIVIVLVVLVSEIIRMFTAG